MEREARTGEELAEVGLATTDVAAHVVRVVRFQRRGRHRVAGEHLVAKTGREAFDLGQMEMAPWLVTRGAVTAKLAAAYAKAEAEGLGAVNVDGVMVDVASIRILNNTLRKAELIGM